MNIPKSHKRNTCRGCGGTDLAQILDLGEMPQANAFINPTENFIEDKFPLTAYLCSNCFLFQLLDVVDPKILFRHYDYLTSASAPLAEHFRSEARYLAERFQLSKKDLVVEIGGNDGVLLDEIRAKCRTLNVEPAENIADISRSKGIETTGEFFTAELARGILRKYGGAKIIVANNVMAHIDDLDGVFDGVKLLLADDGAFVFEVHWLGNLMGDGGFDQIYHEHLCYYSLTALNKMVERMGLVIFDVESVPIHGESMRVYAGKNRVPGTSVTNFLDKERKLSLAKLETFIKFKNKAAENKNKIVTLLTDLKKAGKAVIGYGAPAKGNTLLNYCGVTTDLINFLTDTTSFKQGLLAPGSRIPVYSPEKLKERRPDYVLLLAWNYAESILAKEKELRANGTKFIIPVPEPRIV